MDLVNMMLLFDESLPGPSLTEVLIWTGVIIVASNLIFVVLCALVGINSSKTLDHEKSAEYSEWLKNKVSPWAVAGSEFLNSSLYSPVAEELAFRFLLLKILCVRGLGMNFWVANVVQALVFGTMHMTNVAFTTQTKTYTYLQTLSASISGLVSGWVYRQSNSILPPLIAHVLNNASAGFSEVMGYVDYRRKAAASTTSAK